MSYSLDKYSQFRISLDGRRARAFNYRNGALAEFDLIAQPHLRRIIDGGGFLDNREVCENLDFVLNFMVSSDTSSQELVRQNYNSVQKATDDLNLTVLTTLACNFSCYYCYEKREPGRMSPLVQQRVFDLLTTRMSGLRRASINWYGGEPLLVKDAITEITTKTRDLCSEESVQFRSKMISNCYLLDKKTSRELHQSGIDEIQVSFDGSRDIHDTIRHQGGKKTFDRIVGNISEANEYFNIIIRVNVSERNKTSIEELLDQLSNAGVSSFAIIYFANLHANGVGCSDMSEPDLNDLISTSEFSSQSLEYKRQALSRGFKVRTPLATTNICSAVVEGGFVIEPNGNLQKCYLDVGNHNESIGAMDLTGRKVIPIRSFNSANETKWTSFSPFDDSECATCVALPICFSGCPWEAMRGRPKADRCHPLKNELSQYLDFFFESLEGGAEFEPSMKTLQIKRH